MTENLVLHAGPPSHEHRQAIVDKVIGHTQNQIEAVCRHYVEQHVQYGLSIEEAQALLRFAFLMRSSNDSSARALLMHPTTQYWLAAMRRASGDVDIAQRRPFARHVSSLALQVELANEGQGEWDIDLDQEGGLRIPIFARHIEFGPERAGQTVRVSCLTGFLRCSFADGMTIELPNEDLLGDVQAPEPALETDGFWINCYQRLADDRVQLQRRDEWLRPHWTGTNERQTGTIFFGASEEQYPANHPVEPYKIATENIKSSSREIAEDVFTFTPVMVPRTTGKNQRIGFTVLSRQGAMFLDPDEPKIMAENIIHENAHVKLRYMQLVDPILENFYDDDKQRFPVPWRPDPRPLPGILEGAYVFSNVLEHRRKSGIKADVKDDLERDVAQAIDLLAEHGKFTEAGRSFLNELACWK